MSSGGDRQVNDERTGHEEKWEVGEKQEVKNGRDQE